MLKTILEIEIPRKLFDEIFPEELCVLRNEPRYREQYWGYSYSSVEDVRGAIGMFCEQCTNLKYKERLRHELDIYNDIIHGRGATEYVIIREDVLGYAN